jgi:hypothetical protein
MTLYYDLLIMTHHHARLHTRRVKNVPEFVSSKESEVRACPAGHGYLTPGLHRKECPIILMYPIAQIVQYIHCIVGSAVNT